MNKRILSSVQMIPISFFIAIMLGALMLMLPVASAEGRWTSFMDALFTSATSICVTGLTVVDTGAHWSFFGQLIIVFLIQIGGLGVIAVVSLLMVAMQKRFSLGDRIMLRDSLNLDTTPGVIKFLLRIIRATFMVELLGMIVYSFVFVPRYGLARGLWVSCFNSVSAFCNAGMDILGEDSLAAYDGNIVILAVTMTLVILGGGGFVAWFDIKEKFIDGIKKHFSISQIVSRLSEHTKLVLNLTWILIVFGTGIIFLAEYNNPDTIGNMSLGGKILNSMFESVTYRTAGFSTFSQAKLTDISCVFAYLLMFIGGSPIGTAGGVKTTTFYFAVLNVTSYLHGEDNASVFHTSVSAAQMRKATVIVSVSLVTVVLSTLLLIATNPVSMQDGLFEIVSASGTVGLTRDITPKLNTAGKLIVTVTMYLGRIAPISMAIFLAGIKNKKAIKRHPEGKFFIG
ncbi:MAG: potassium transporter TrkH [Lentisphaeria bacterium]|nr:potassium transporter TrkH [Lentisphaeria bacterium]